LRATSINLRKSFTCSNNAARFNGFAQAAQWAEAGSAFPGAAWRCRLGEVLFLLVGERFPEEPL